MEAPDPPWRILDANLNRATEGLRVVEDYLRLVVDDVHLAGHCKSLRHELARIARLFPRDALLRSRAAAEDVGQRTKTDSEFQRDDAAHVVRASVQRVQQALRCLEEFGKLIDPVAARDCEALRFQVYTLEQACGILSLSRTVLHDARLCVLVDPQTSLGEFSRLCERLVEAGAPLLQLRVKAMADREWLGRAHRLREITRGTTARWIMNDRADLARLAQADGVHVGQDDLTAADVRRIVGPRPFVGLSTHSLTQAREAVLAGGDYLGVGPTFPSKTKSFAQFPGLTLLRQVAGEISLPVYAIGGITRANLAQVLQTGIQRVAVQGDIVQDADPAAACREFLQILAVRHSPRPAD